MRITIKDIARIVGVAHSTVTRALEDNPRISTEMRERIKRVALELGYVPNSNAQAMRTNKSRLVGFVVPNVEDNDLITIAQEVADCCNQQGLQLVLALSQDDPERERAQLRALVGAKVAGVVIVPTANPLPESLALLRHQPVVQAIRRIDSIPGSRLCFNDFDGIRIAVTHLLSLGHRHIAYLGSSPHLTTGQGRLAGYRRAYADFGLAPDNSLMFTTTPDAKEVDTLVANLISERKPSALVLGGSRITAHAVSALSKMGVDIPNDLSVVGFGDHAWHSWWGPGLTTIGLPVRELGKGVGLHLLERLNAGEHSTSHLTADQLLDPFLIIRGSTRPIA